MTSACGERLLAETESAATLVEVIERVQLTAEGNIRSLITVSGLTTAFRIAEKNRYSQTKINLSRFRGRTSDRDLRLKTITC
jgi:hypothetical protein